MLYQETKKSASPNPRLHTPFFKKLFSQKNVNMFPLQKSLPFDGKQQNAPSLTQNVHALLKASLRRANSILYEACQQW